MEENLKSEFEEDLKQIREDYNRAKRLLSNIEEFTEKFNKLKNLLDDEKDGVDVNYKWIKSKVDEISSFYDNSNNYLNNIKTNLDKVKSNIDDMNESYLNFTELKGKITGRNNEIENILSQSTSLKDDISRIKTESQGLLDKINTLFSDFQVKIEDMKTAYQNFLNIKEQIEDEESGLEAIFEEVKSMKDDSFDLLKDIRKYKEESNEVLKQIQNNKNSSDNLKSEIESNLSFSNDKKQEIQEVTDLILDTGFANSFQSRAKKLFWGYVIWGIIFGISIISFIVFLIILFYDKDLNTIPSPDIVLYRLSLTTPLLFLIGFSIKQYSKERELNEKYEFKSTIATVIRNHINFLIGIFGKDSEKIIEFTSNTFNTLYKEPYSEDKLESIKKLEKEIDKLKSSNNNISKIEIDDIIKSVKELKEIIPDEGSLKKIINLFISK